MRRNIFISTFFITQLLLIFLYLRKQESIIAHSYDKQRSEQILQGILKENEQISVQLEVYKQTFQIKKFACEALEMIPLQLIDIRKMPDEV